LQGFIIYGFHPLARWRYRHIPGPPFRFLVGGFPEIARSGLETAFTEWAARYAPTTGIYKVVLGGRPHVIVCSPGPSKKVSNLVQKYQYPVPLSAEDWELLQHNMLFIENAGEWAKVRNAWTPQFKTERLKAQLSIIERGVTKLVQRMHEVGDGECIDVWPLMGKLTMDVITTASVGIQSNTLEERKINGDTGTAELLADRLTGAVRAELESVDVQDWGIAAMYLFPEASPLINWAATTFPSRMERRGQEARRVYREMFSTLIQSVRSGNPDEAIVDPTSFLYAMAHVTDPTTGEVKDEAWTLMQSLLFTEAGYETTASSLAYTYV
jgi:cytochrome P450